MEVHQIDLQTLESNLMMFQRTEITYNIYYTYLL